MNCLKRIDTVRQQFTALSHLQDIVVYIYVAQAKVKYIFVNEDGGGGR